MPTNTTLLTDLLALRDKYDQSSTMLAGGPLTAEQLEAEGASLVLESILRALHDEELPRLVKYATMFDIENERLQGRPVSEEVEEETMRHATDAIARQDALKGRGLDEWPEEIGGEDA